MTGKITSPKSEGTWPVLPDLVVDLIIQHLEPSDFPTLRLICKTTNSWITQNPKLLKQLRLEISTEESLNEISKSLVLWININFRVPPGDLELERNIKVLKFFQTFGPFIHFLDLDPIYLYKSWDISSLDASPPEPRPRKDSNYVVTTKDFQIIMEFCSSLHTLRIGRLQLTGNEAIANSMQIFIQNNYQNLKVLEIQELICNNEEEYQYFGNSLLCFLSLEIVYLPWTPNNPSQHILAKYFLKPVITYVLNQKSRGNSTLRAINFGQHKIKDSFLLDDFHVLARTCYVSKILIITPIPSWDAGFLHLFSPIELQPLENIEIEIGNVIPPLAEIELTNLKRFYISRSFCSETATIFNNNNELLESYKNRHMFFKMPNLQEVFVNVYNYCNENDDRFFIQFINFMIWESFPSVRILCVKRFKCSLTTILGAWDISIGFPNLVKLKLSYCLESPEVFVTLLSGLKLLEEVSLHHCPHFGDDAIVGSENDREDSPLLRLEYLKRIHINGCGAITDRSYRLVFQHLKVKYFYHHVDFYVKISDCNHAYRPHYRPQPQVTKVGLNFLIQGEFCNSIETMEIYDYGLKWDEESIDFLNKFPNLKRKPCAQRPISISPCICSFGDRSHFGHVIMLIFYCFLFPFLTIYVLLESGCKYCQDQYFWFGLRHPWVLPLFIISFVLLSFIILIYFTFG